MPALDLAAAAAPPAGGAALDQVIIATAFGLFVTVALAVLCLGHRSGRIGLLAWGGRISDRYSPLPGWAGVPAFVALVTLLPTLFGLQWDESLHIGSGRDEGPLANPSHFFLLQGIFGAFAAGVIGMAMADERVPRSGLDLPGAWRVPLGAALAALGAGVALIGFPLDDVWHRLFGQDITLWSPTHMTMLVGMAVSVLGVLVLVIEGLRSRIASRPSALAAAGPTQPLLLERALPRLDRAVQKVSQPVVRYALAIMLPAALLLVVSLPQGEYDFGVTQFRLILHPMAVLVAAGTALVAARIFLGRGAALAAVLGYVAIRGAISLLVGPVLGEASHVFPLYIAEALLVEAVALRIPVRRPLAFGLASGALIGTVGLAAEWAWSGVFPYSWTEPMLVPAVILGFGMAMAGSLIGAWMGAHMMIRNPIRTPALRNAAVGSALAITAMLAFALHEGGGQRIDGSVTLTEVSPAPQRTVQATVRLDPADAAEDAVWFRSISWQGGGLSGEPLRRVSPGVWETTEPMPVYGEWKTALRLHYGDRMLGLPIFLPEDSAIPAEEVPAEASFTREFEGEKQFLQREAKEGSGLISFATWVVAILCIALLAISAAALHRLAASAELDRESPGPGEGRGPGLREPSPQRKNDPDRVPAPA